MPTGLNREVSFRHLRQPVFSSHSVRADFRSEHRNKSPRIAMICYLLGRQLKKQNCLPGRFFYEQIAVNAIVLALIPADGPTVQDKTAAGFDDDSAAGISIVSTGDDAAGLGILYGQTALDGDNVAPFPGIA